MVKEVQLSITIKGYSAKDYHHVIYTGTEAFQQYHKEHSKDPTARVTSWDAGKRTIQFNLALNVPQMLKKVIGAESITVVETQEIEWQSDSRFVVKSEPSLNFPGSGKFTTKGLTTIYTDENNDCQVDAVIICSAAMPWPMQSTVEAAMATEAQTGVNKFLQFCIQYCDAYRPKLRKAVQAPHVSAVQAPRPAITTEDGDQFFDAYDVEISNEQQAEMLNNQGRFESQRATSLSAASTPMSVHGHVHGAQGMQLQSVNDAGGVGAYANLGLNAEGQEYLIQAVRELQRSSQATAVVLAEVVTQLRSMNEQIRVIRTCVAPHVPVLLDTVPTTAQPHLLTNGVKPPSVQMTLQSTAASTSNYAYLAYACTGAVLAAAGTLSMVYLRSKTRSQ